MVEILRKIHQLRFSAFAGAFADYASAVACLKASISIHATFLSKFFCFAMSFFWTNPVGRTLARFSNDIQTIDDRLSKNLEVISFAAIQVRTCVLS